MIKKIVIHAIFILVVSCGFQPMLKDFDISNLKIKKISYVSENNELNYILQNNLNLNAKPNSNGLIINLSIFENISSITKNTAGISTEEELKILIKLNVKDHKLNNLLNETLSEVNRLQITNNLGTDDTTKNNVRKKTINNLGQKIKFKLMILANN